MSITSRRKRHARFYPNDPTPFELFEYDPDGTDTGGDKPKWTTKGEFFGTFVKASGAELELNATAEFTKAKKLECNAAIPIVATDSVVIADPASGIKYRWRVDVKPENADFANMRQTAIITNHGRDEVVT